MAHDPNLKALAFNLFVVGKGITAVHAVLKADGVAKSTVSDWHKEWELDTRKTTAATQENAFVKAYAAYGVATMDMFTSLARTISNPDFIKDKTVDDLIKHATFVRDSFIVFERLHQTASPTLALAERSETVIGIPVEDED